MAGLGYRKNPTGRKSSPLDEIRPERWTGDMTRKLLKLLWVLEVTVKKGPELAEFLTEITSSEVFTADELPSRQRKSASRQGWKWTPDRARFTSSKTIHICVICFYGKNDPIH